MTELRIVCDAGHPRLVVATVNERGLVWSGPWANWREQALGGKTLDEWEEWFDADPDAAEAELHRLSTGATVSHLVTTDDSGLVRARHRVGCPLCEQHGGPVAVFTEERLRPLLPRFIDHGVSEVDLGALARYISG